MSNEQVKKGDIEITVKDSNGVVPDAFVSLEYDGRKTSSRTNVDGIARFRDMKYGKYVACARKDKKFWECNEFDHKENGDGCTLQLLTNRGVNNSGRILFIVKDGIYQNPAEGVEVTMLFPTPGVPIPTDSLGELMFEITDTTSNYAQFKITNPITNQDVYYIYSLIGNPIIIQQHSI